MAEWLKVIILGIVEGITEFLPISSTGHLIVAAELLDLRDSLRFTFEIFIQLGAVVAVIIFYWGDIWRQVTTVRTDAGVRHFWLCIVVAFIPAALLGLLFDDLIESVLASPLVVAVALMVGGVILIVVERRVIAGQPPTVSDLTAISYRQALLIGFAQTFALIPGVSRAAASIVGALLLGLNRTTATAFSFYLAIPTLGAATIYTLLRDLDSVAPDDLVLLLLGAVVSGLVAWLAIRWLLNYIARHSFVPFGYYRIVAGGLFLLLIALGWISPGAV